MREVGGGVLFKPEMKFRKSENEKAKKKFCAVALRQQNRYPSGLWQGNARYGAAEERVSVSGAASGSVT